MWDKIFTASLAAHAISSVIMLLGHFVWPGLPTVFLIGAILLGLAATAVGISGIVIVLGLQTTKSRRPSQ